MKDRFLFLFLLVYFVLAHAGCSPTESSKSASNESSVIFNQNSQQDKAVSSDSQSEGYENVNSSSFSSIVDKLAVEPESQIDYDRDLFGDWIDEDGNSCNTRKEVLISESRTSVEIGKNCSIISGSWYSEFDGLTTTDDTELHIDHFVPLSEAWKSGAFRWDDVTRKSYANDLGFEGSLIAVTSTSNLSKGNRDPASWLPEETSYHCQYILNWVLVKFRWSLSVDEEELKRLREVSDNCDFIYTSIELPEAAQIAFSEVIIESDSPTSASPEQDSCLAGQVDINSAPLEELMKIIHIGNARAIDLIKLRPFNSVSELTKISGIADSRIKDILDQNIACVG